MSSQAVFWIAAGLLALAALALTAWAWFGDRSRDPRCRRCWYPMDGAPDLTCPECGWRAPSEAVLTKRRRRWGWIRVAGASLLVGAAIATHAWVRARPGGWWTVAPSGVLMSWIETKPGARDALWDRIQTDDPSETFGRPGALSKAQWRRLAERCSEVIEDQSLLRDARSWATITLGCVIPDAALVDEHIERLLTNNDDGVRRDALGGVYPYYLQRDYLSERWLDEVVVAASDADCPISAEYAMNILCRTSPLQTPAIVQAITRADDAGALDMVWDQAVEGLAHPRIDSTERRLVLTTILADPGISDDLRGRVESLSLGQGD